MFENISKKLGFGLMRLPMKENEVDILETSKMVDLFIEAGFNYFDTAHGYIDGKSEKAVKECLTSRYERDKYILANKLSIWLVESYEDIISLFNEQLRICGVDYFDFYLLHSLNVPNYKKCKELNAFEYVKKLKEEGKIKHIAISFHDTADVLDTILSEQPIIEAVQLQINYLDYDDPSVQSKACYDVAVKHGKKVIVMEPVKGGALVNLPSEAKKLFDDLKGGSYASYALRYAAGYENVIMVLSGMGNTAMMMDNISSMSDFVPLNEKELSATDKAREIIRKLKQIPCTACNYCADVCPVGIPISKIFSSFNKCLTAEMTAEEAAKLLPADSSKVHSCADCGLCETVCPQTIEIRKTLQNAAENLGIKND